MAYVDIPFDQYTPEDIVTKLNVTVTSVMLLSQALVPKCIKNSTIVAISGTFEDDAKGWLPSYVAKQALECFR